MTKQMELNFNAPDGKQLRDEGIEKAVTHADNVYDEWSTEAYAFLYEFTRSNNEFTAEDVRNASVNIVPEPPDNRAWGSIFKRAIKSNLIKRKDFTTAKNPTSHCATVALWMVNN